MKSTPDPLISIVDDDESVRQALKSLIDSVGFRAQVFGSGEEFLNSAYVLQTDCLIADVRMPGMTGLELQERLNAAGSDIPIVFGVAGDPVRLGLVSSLARPGGNVTGLSNQSAELPGKRLALLREAIPGLQRLAILANVGGLIGILEMREVETAARSLGLEVFTLEIQKAEDIEPVFGSLKTGADALYVVTDPVVNSNRIRINTLALAAQLPTLHAEKAYVEAGGLISYGPNFPDLFRRAAEMVDKVFRGTKPAEIPVPKDGDGIWIHTADGRLHVHVGAPAGELNLER